MVFESSDKWTIVDIEELHKHIKETKLRKFYLKDLVSKLDWTMFLDKSDD